MDTPTVKPKRFVMTKRLKKWLIFGGVGVLIVGSIVYGTLNKKSTIEYTTADVTRGALTQTVSETGSITPAKEIELNFPSTGQLTVLSVKVGEQVKLNQPLGQIDSSNLSIRRQEAAASLAAAQAGVIQAQGTYASARREFDKLTASLSETLKQAQKTLRDLEDKTPATLTTTEQSISTAESNLATTKETYQRAISNKYDALSVALFSKLATNSTALDAIDRILEDDYARADLGADNLTALRQAKLVYADASSLNSQAKMAAAAAKAAPSSASIGTAYTASQTAMGRTFEALNLMFTVLRASTTSSDFSQFSLDTFKASIDGQLVTISAATSSLQTALQAYDDAQLAYDTNVLSSAQALNQAKVSYENALVSARNNVASAITARDQQLSSVQSRVDSAQANLAVVDAQVGQAVASMSLINDQIADNTLKSPIKGIVTKVNYEIGEQVTPTKALLSVLTENNYQLEVDIAETDISKIKTGNSAEITLDSLGESVKFQGAVYFIDPAETIIQGVTYYKVKVSFDPSGQAVKPGMTANAVITTDHRDDVLMMPARAIVEKDGKKMVRILENNIPREVEVTIGLSGDDGLVEVLSGVKEGDKVVTFLKDSSKK